MTGETKPPGERPNRGWVRLLVILASVLTFVAIVATWADRQLLDSEEWSNTAAEMLADDQISQELAEFAVSELYANVNVDKELKDILPGDLKSLSGPAAGGLRQVATQVAERAFEDPRFQNLWQNAHQTAHSNLVAILEDDSEFVSTNDGEVVLELRPLILEVADQVGLGDTVADRLPDDVGNVEIVKSDELGLAQTVTSLIKGIALAASLVVLALFALAVYLSRGYRWLTILKIGAGLIIVGLIVMILRSVAGGVVVDRLADPDIQPAAESAYAIGTSLLGTIAWSVIWGGVILIAVAWLSSPTGAARTTRKVIAYPVNRFPWAYAGVLAFVALIWILSGIGSTREVLLRLGIVLVAGLAAWVFQRRLAAEFPDAKLAAPDIDLDVGEISGRVKDKAEEIWNARPKSLPGAPGGGSRAATDATDRRLEQYERLASLHERGVLSDEEFAAEKARLRDGEP